MPFDAQRAVHTLDPVGKAFYGCLLSKMNIPSPLPQEYGYIKHRRREAAIKQQLIMQWKLKKLGLSHMTISHDMRNAFASVSLDILTNVLSFLTCEDDWPLVEQRFRCASVCVPEENALAFTIESGALPGDKVAADFFRQIFQTAVKTWVSDPSPMQVKCPVSLQNVDVAKSAYADDLCDKKSFLTTLSKKPCNTSKMLTTSLTFLSTL